MFTVALSSSEHWVREASEAHHPSALLAPSSPFSERVSLRNFCEMGIIGRVDELVCTGTVVAWMDELD